MGRPEIHLRRSTLLACPASHLNLSSKYYGADETLTASKYLLSSRNIGSEPGGEAGSAEACACRGVVAEYEKEIGEIAGRP